MRTIQCAAQENRQVHQTQTSNSADEHVFLLRSLEPPAAGLIACVVHSGITRTVLLVVGDAAVLPFTSARALPGPLLNFLMVGGSSTQSLASNRVRSSKKPARSR